jgi:hypothetical protein
MAELIDSRRERRATATICDGRGGSLLLDLSNQETHWLADACQRLAAGETPPSASMLKVHAAGETYLLTRHTGAEHEIEVHIANLFDPGEHVALTRDLVEIVTSLIGHALNAGGRISIADAL